VSGPGEGPRFPPLADVLPLLEGPGGALVHASAASSRAFSATGRRAAAWGSELTGLEGLRVGAWTLMGLASGSGPAAAVVTSPSCVRRETVRSAGSVLETLLVPLDLAAAALQWRRPAGAAAALELELSWTLGCAHGTGPLTHEVHPEGLALADAQGTTRALLLLRPAPASWQVEPGGEPATLRIRAAVQALPGGAVTLVLATGDGWAQVKSTLRTASGLRVQEVRAEHALDDAREEQLSTHTGVAALDDGVEWAKARIRGAVVVGQDRARTLRRGGGACGEARPLAEPGGASAVSPLSPLVEPVWVALGGLAAGDPEPAETALEGDLSTPYHLLLAGRLVAWTGEGGALMRHRARLDEAARVWAEAWARAQQGGEVDGAAHAVTALALRELAEGWEALGDRPRAQALRARLSGPGGPGAAPAGVAPAPFPSPSPTAVRLPMRGQGAPPPAAVDGGALLVRALLERAPGGAGAAAGYRAAPDPAAAAGRVERVLQAWALCRSGDPDAGYQRLREHLDAGVQAGGLWSELAEDRRSCPDHAAAAALGPAALLFGLLGAEADAAVGRIRLAPRLPTAWGAFRVGGIRAGDARIALDYARVDGAHSYRLRQESGRIPFMLIFEPELPVQAIAEVQVDGQPAELDQFRREGRAGTRIQLPIDRERTVVIRAV